MRFSSGILSEKMIFRKAIRSCVENSGGAALRSALSAELAPAECDFPQRNSCLAPRSSIYAEHHMACCTMLSKKVEILAAKPKRDQSTRTAAILKNQYENGIKMKKTLIRKYFVTHMYLTLILTAYGPKETFCNLKKPRNKF
jgi:hypothetical protein